ncbi:hypothetical protein PbB2_01147 [Candidatus Phycosocius bacilliformis]|uniref:Uncharacterized protein n=1 Tax=Candidatus Phycosocius bacilliformis TaxID=1445552 RepID=A0A2P2E8T6_9PROT|nr:PQQ-binding-like beta-propeller repeat protein [Candidatus Phycosocius bacilliformis]GBF57480.1 hypothetical protein PbB2_01147 [Candidatus Phycosocius bacilliformis]
MAINANIASLLNSGAFSSASTGSLDLSVLANGGSTAARSGPPTKTQIARMAPWDSRAPQPTLSKVAADALRDTRLVNTSLGTGPGSAVRDDNDRDLFIIHNSVQKLQALADAAAKDGVSADTRKRIQERINRGLAEVNAHIAATKLEGAYLIGGRRLNRHESEGIQRGLLQYDTKPLVNGDMLAIPQGFLGDRRFNLKVTKNGVTTNIDINLADMGTTDRTVGNVASFVSNKLEAAGFESRFERVQTKLAPTTKGGTETLQQRLRITTTASETLTFEAVAGDSQPALYVAGGKTIDGAMQSVVSKLTGLNGTDELSSFSADLAAAKGGTAGVRASVVGPDGSLYVIADATAKVNGQTPKGKSDVILMKYDTTGQVSWTRSLGSAAPAQGFSLAIGADGTLAVAGAVDGRADTLTSTTGNGLDSFVAAFDAEGRDKWYFQQGATGSDSATQVKVGDDGSVYVMGTTTASYGGAATLGGKDVYLQAFDATGTIRFTQSLGTANDDSPGGLVLANGQALAVWNETGGARMQAFDQVTGTAIGSVNNLGSANLNAVTQLAADSSGRMFLAGRETAGGVANKLVALEISSGNVLFTKQSTTGEAIRALTAAGDQVAYATNTITIPTTGGTTRETTIVGLDADTGSQNFSRAANQAADAPVAIALAANVSESLDSLGIPQGQLRFGMSDELTDRTGLRAGDQFAVIVNGGAEKKITISDGETMRTLAAKLNRVLMRDGTAEARSLRGVESLVITPKPGDRIELKAVGGVADALKQLGLEPGVAVPRPAKATGGTKSVSDPPPIIALEMPITGDVSDKTKAKALLDSFDGVLRRLRIGYREISTDPTQVELRKQNAANAAKKAAGSGSGVAYYNKQTALGQDALRRLGVSV